MVILLRAAAGFLATDIMNNYFATCPKGIEPLLVDELGAIGASDVRSTVSGVYFKGDLSVGYRAALWTRFASRVLINIAEFGASDDFELYLGVNNISWEKYFDPSSTIAVDFSGVSESIKNTLYGAQKIKDAIVDRFSKRFGERPNVDKDNPDVRIVAHLNKRQKVSINFDITGVSLHRRSYRSNAGAAPLKENLAAAIVARARPEGTVVDPMCGSGTILIEAAMKLTDTAPGLLRENIGFANLKIHDPQLWKSILLDAKARSAKGREQLQQRGVKLYGFDQDQRVIEIARTNAENAGFADLIEFDCVALKDLKKPEGAGACSIITNPPYGERLGNFTELLDLYSLLGAKFRQEFPGSTATVISSSADLLSCIRLRADKTYKLFNGALECLLKNYVISERRDEEQSASAVKETVLSSGAQEFANRLKKNLKNLKKWIESESLEAYRIYDADLPNYNAAIDVYAGYAVVQEYAPPKTVSPKTAHERLLDIMQVTRSVLDIPGDRVIVKRREKQKGDEQYRKLDDLNHTVTVHEYGAKYIVNLYDYLDTGLFCDHRLVRKYIRMNSRDRDFLNLFAYTGTATVQAALGGARTTTTVDMSRTYLNWAKENLRINNFTDRRKYLFEQADCLKWISECTAQFDLIFVDPPTFSNSKRMDTTFDVERDHVQLLSSLKELLRPGGSIIFSNNRKNFRFDYDKIGELGFTVRDLSAETLSKDYVKAKALHNCWLLTL